MNQSIDVIFILDASGSMGHLVSDTVGGINKFLEDQKLVEGDAYVTLWTFDTTITQRYQARKLDENSPPLTAHDYYDGHGGGTALLDAVGKAVTTYDNLPLKAHRTAFVITTDGQENSSHEFTKTQVSELIKKHQASGWAFIFLGANDSEWQGRDLGTQSVGAYRATPAGVAASYDNLSANTRSMRESDLSPAQSTAAMDWSTGEDAKP